MKNYLNRAQRELFIMLAGTAEWLECQANEMRDKEHRKWLKTAKSFVWKVTDALAKEIPPEAWQRILKQAGQCDVVLAPKGVAKSSNLEDVYLLADFAIGGWCRQCRDKAEGCELRDVLLRLKVPGMNEEGDCEYRQTCREAV
ncbi:DUF5651 domain-containing protein [Moorella sp. E306M]|uniref:DUF5651 domain-containing protein n=1 Tax=Moorella sp. E306M TaxID=2572683 RepID=UPI0010FFC410|nr:DUF5651 domain-containing protein [Moorella sp. E306M]GEA17762.1 hypothetical protein E306M_08960 [Moorella sp. E306M]GEA17831.1 hypothetical protein E306M_09650 [Moorella sp. E306M]